MTYCTQPSAVTTRARLRRLGGAVALAVALQLAPALAQEKEQGTYRIAAGDVLEVNVWRNKDLTMTVVVRPDGFVSFPVLNDVRAAGLTPVELGKKVEAGLAATVPSPMVTILVSKIAGFRVSVLGKVRQAGRYEMEASATALDALAMAGGPNDYAASSGIYVLRKTATGTFEEIPVRYSTGAGKANSNVAIQAGDIVVVP